MAYYSAFAMTAVKKQTVAEEGVGVGRTGRWEGEGLELTQRSQMDKAYEEWIVKQKNNPTEIMHSLMLWSKALLIASMKVAIRRGEKVQITKIKNINSPRIMSKQIRM